MPIQILPTSLGKGRLILGDDHLLECTLTWDDETHPDLENSTFYLSIRENILDAEAAIAINSIDNPTQFVITDNANGEMEVSITSEDQASITPEVRYFIDMLIILPDGKTKHFIYDTVVFLQSITR